MRSWYFFTIKNHKDEAFRGKVLVTLGNHECHNGLYWPRCDCPSGYATHGTTMMPSVFFAFFLLLPKSNSHHNELHMCLDAIRWKGKTEDVSIVREALSGGILVSQTETLCRGVVIEVGFSHGLWILHMHRKENTVTHFGPDLQVAATWIESHLVPPVGISLPVATQGTLSVVNAPQVPVISVHRPYPKMMAILFSGATLSQEYQGAGMGAEFDLRIRGAFWSGFSACVFYMPQQSGIQRDQITAQIQVGTRFRWQHLNFLPGGSIGISHIELKRFEDEGTSTTATRSDVLLGLFLRAQFAITHQLSLLAELAAQVSAGNLSAKITSLREDENTNQEKKKFFKANAADEVGLTTNTSSFLIRVGIAWQWNGR